MPSSTLSEGARGRRTTAIGGKKGSQALASRKTRTECLEYHLDMLAELVSTLVMALGQNAANVAPPSLRGFLLLTWRARRLSLPNRARMSRPTRHRPEPASVEGRLSVDAEMLLDQLKRIASPPWTLIKLNRLMIQSLIDLNGQQPTLTWTMTMTLSLITLLA